jgi:hypothetical protein
VRANERFLAKRVKVSPSHLHPSVGPFESPPKANHQIVDWVESRREDGIVQGQAERLAVDFDCK